VAIVSLGGQGGTDASDEAVREFAETLRDCYNSRDAHALLIARNKRLREALEWYADRASGIHGNDDAEALEEDQGTRARAALKEPKS